MVVAWHNPNIWEAKEEFEDSPGYRKTTAATKSQRRLFNTHLPDVVSCLVCPLCYFHGVALLTN